MRMGRETKRDELIALPHALLLHGPSTSLLYPGGSTYSAAGQYNDTISVRACSSKHHLE
jgi:hypothetical protein